MTRSVLAAVLSCVLVCGCSHLPKPALPKLAMRDLPAVGGGSRSTLATAEDFSEIKLTYRTSSDRLNVASGGDAELFDVLCEYYGQDPLRWGRSL